MVTSNATEVTSHAKGEHRPVPIEHLASKGCLVCGRAYRYSHNARRHELTSHGYDRYTNKIDPAVSIANARNNSKTKSLHNSSNNRLDLSHSQSIDIHSQEPEILKSLLTSKSEDCLSESENIPSRSESPESDSEMQPYQVEAIISEPDAYVQNSDVSDDENNLRIDQSPRSNSDIEYDVDLDLSSHLDINKIIGVDGGDYVEYNEDLNEEYDDEGQNVMENVESEVICSADTDVSIPNINQNDMETQCEQDDYVPDSLVPIVELNESTNVNNDSDDSEVDDDINNSPMLERHRGNDFTITVSQRDFLLKYRDIIEQINTMRCKCCDKEFPRRKAVIQHLQKNGSKIPKHTCYSCILSFNNIGALLSHMRYNCCIDTWRLIYRLDNLPNEMIVEDVTMQDSQDSYEKPYNHKDFASIMSYACRFCSTKFQMKQYVIKHTIDVHAIVAKVPPLTCFSCKYKFVDGQSWKKHLQNGECTVEMSCDLCNEKFKSLQDFNEHVLISHMDVFTNQSIENNIRSSNGRSTSCSLCKNSFSNYHNLIKHLKMVHNEDRPHGCPCCPSKFGDVAELNQHIYMEHTEQMVNGQDEESDMREEIVYNYSCTECDAVFETVDGWTEHQISVHHHIAYECEHCGKKYWDENELEEHRLIHTRMHIYKCTSCPLTFANTQQLTDHIIQYHHDPHDKSFETQFYCEICKRFFKSRQAFSNHMRIHAKVPTTNRRAGEVKRPDGQVKAKAQTQNNKTTLKSAKMVTPAPYSCDICGKGFLHKKNIWKHKKILHSDIVGKPKENPEVTKIKHVSTEEDDYTNDAHSQLTTPQFDSFVSTVFDNHENSGSESNLMYQCDLCDKKFAVKSSIWKHKRVKHGIANPATPEIPRIESAKSDRVESMKSDPTRITCTICKINFTDKKAYYRHRKIAHKTNTHSCKMCGIGLNSQIELFQHLQNVHAKDLLGYNASQIKPQKKNQINMSNASSDEDEVGSLNNTSSTKYSCDTCGKNFADLTGLHNHSCIQQGSMSETYNCEICNKSYTSISALKSHRGWHLRSPDGRAAISNSGLWMPQNKVTSKVSKHEVVEQARAKTQSAQPTQNEMSPSQIKRKLPPDVQVTLLKKKKFSNETNMEQTSMISQNTQSSVNQQLAMNEDRYCESCDKVFTKKAAYQRHIEEVHKHSTVVCPICSKSFTRKSTLLVHMMKHDTGNGKEESDEEQDTSFQDHRPPPVYRCEVCNLQYSSSKALRRHRLKHHAEIAEAANHVNAPNQNRITDYGESTRFIEEGVEKEYKCGLCEEEWDTEEEVWNHQHYRCQTCGAYFSQHQYLVEHTQTHHPEKEQVFFPCGKCDRFYTNKKSLQRHIETFH